MLEFIQKQLVWAVAMPLSIAIVCMVIAWRPWQRDGRETVRGWWGGPLAVGLGYLVGHMTINQWPAWPPAQATDNLFFIAVATIIVGLTEAIRLPAPVRWALRALLCLGVSWFMISNGYKSGHRGGVVAAWTVGQAVGIVLIWTLTERLAQRRPGPSIPLALSLLIAVASVFFLVGSSARLAQLAGVLGAALGGVSLVAMSVQRVSVARGMLAVMVPLYSALILYSWQYDKPLGTPIILAAAPLTLWLAEWRESATAAIGRILLVGVPALIALSLLLWFQLDQAAGESLY